MLQFVADRGNQPVVGCTRVDLHAHAPLPRIAVNVGDARAEAAFGAVAELHDDHGIRTLDLIDEATELCRPEVTVDDESAHFRVGRLESYELKLADLRLRVDSRAP